MMVVSTSWTFMCVCHSCFISHNTALQKLLSLISIVCQTQDRQADMLSFVIVSFLWYPACTQFYITSWSLALLCTLPSKMSSCLAMSLSLMHISCLIRASAWHELSVMNVLGNPGPIFVSTFLRIVKSIATNLRISVCSYISTKWQ